MPVTAESGQYVHEYAIEVRREHIDANDHVNNIVYMEWVNEATASHWLAAATDEQKVTTVWMVLRHEIDYLKQAFEGDKLIVRTWVGEDKGVRWERFVELIRPQDETVLIRARSVWLALDPMTQRPKRVDAAIRERFLKPPAP